MSYFNVFLTGGLICVFGQILIDRTKLTAARVLVLFVVLGCVLSFFGIYEKLVAFGGSGATVPLPGFGNLLFQGVKKAIDKDGAIGILSGGLSAASSGISAAVFCGFFAALFCNSRPR